MVVKHHYCCTVVAVLAVAEVSTTHTYAATDLRRCFLCNSLSCIPPQNWLLLRFPRTCTHIQTEMRGPACCAGAGNDYQKDKQFKKLNAQKDKLEVKVIRDGEQTLVENTDIVVGDLLLLDTGDKIVADGVLAKGFNLVVDEAALTGESEPLNKGDEDVWCMSGSEVPA